MISQKQLQSFFWQWRGVWVATPLICIAIILARYLGFFQPLELFAYDLLIKIRTPLPQDDRIVIVGIGEEDVEKIGSAIISDEIYANVIQNLLKQQPIAIGVDIYRDVPIPPGTDKLSQLFRENQNIVGIEKMVGDTRQYRVKPNPILKEKKQIGFNDVILDPDNKIRRALLALPDKQAFSLSMYLALLFLQKENINLTTVGEKNYWQLGNTVFIPLEKNDGSYAQADSGGYQILLNYRDNVNHFDTVSLLDVLENRIPTDWGKNKIILIGFVGESFQDVHLTPYTNSPDQRMPGVEIHGHIISQIIDSAKGNQDSRTLIKTWSETKENLWIIFWTLLGAIVTWNLRKSSNFRQGIVIFVGIEFILVAIVYFAFLANWWIPLLPPLTGLIAVAGGITIYTARNASKIRFTFGRYLSTEIVNTLLESPQGVKLGGERRTITILTSDLRGFTAVSEQLPPEEVVKILNFYLGYMANIISEYQGTIDEFMGDGILVLFGAPISRNDDADRAIACAIAMQLAMKEINQQIETWGYSPLKMGIGINTGEVVVGNIGSEKRTKYGIVGSEVNLTYRIESYTKGREILISEKTLHSLRNEVQIAETREVSPKGVKKPITIYKIISIKGKYSLFLPEIEEKIMDINKEIKIQYSPLNEKDITEDIYQGKIAKIIIKDIEIGAIIQADYKDNFLPNPLDNLKLNFTNWAYPDDLYGKVVISNRGDSSFKIYFTYLPPQIEQKLFNLCLSVMDKKNNSSY
ncbi:adenylate/guanylate cyclase domain-containing protein [Cyanobacterium aponinum AL20118]|uniref:Adenylate/guanylate cyclase domain-containing protein n=1 Tax=Cyanobacterium aponinum AL20115 TaxID=3090662 RepID=A0AAF0Z9C2_9CHRO|nr:adenylate/guanylate cyclase domain-containing protein [Cyanobacterium aponinum]WPF87783.1 adenylate/guanylate cyclase domain-containing protein [Cyanobacterium aponinum AL20115]